MSQSKNNEESNLLKLKTVPLEHTYFRNQTTFYSEEIVLRLLAQKDAEVSEAVNKGYKLAVKHLKEAYDQNGATTTAEAIEWLADNARLFTPKE